MKTFIKKNEIFLITITVGIFLLFKPPMDPDFGWHFKYGEYMVRNRQFLRENIFSYNMPDYKWANSYWIAQIILYGLYTLTGAIGMGLILSLVTAITIWQILKTASLQKWQISMGSIFLFLFLSLYAATVRPLIFSSLFLLFLMLTLIYKPQNIKFLPFLFLIWANTHADFTLGLFVLGIFNIQQILSQGLKKKNLLMHGISLACVAVTIINPFGFQLWETLLREAHPLQFSHIQEWLPVANKEYFPLFCISAGVIIVSLVEMRDKKKNLWLIFCTSFFSLLSIRSFYFGRISIILGTFPLVTFLGEFQEDISIFLKFLKEKNKGKIKKGLRIVGIVLYLSAGIFFAESIYLAADEKRWAKKAGYPYEEVQKIKSLAKEGKITGGKIFNEYGWGGYLIWKLPEYKTFVDGRMPSWREEGFSVFEDYIEILKGTERSSKLLKEYDINFILIKERSEAQKFFVEDTWEDFSQKDYQLLIKSSTK